MLIDPITDFKVSLDDAIKDKVYLQPEINHYYLRTGESIDLKAIPLFSEKNCTIEGKIIVDGAGVSKDVSAKFECPDGTELFLGHIDYPLYVSEINDWYCINHPEIDADFSLPAGFNADDVIYGKLFIDFSLPWARSAYAPHNVFITINGKEVGRLMNTIPEGRYSFDIDSSVFNYAEVGKAENIPSIQKPSSAMNVEILSPLDGDIITLGEPTLIKASVTGDYGPELYANVTAMFNNSDLVLELKDDGLHDDVSATDCVASGSDAVKVKLKGYGAWVYGDEPEYVEAISNYNALSLDGDKIIYIFCRAGGLNLGTQQVTNYSANITKFYNKNLSECYIYPMLDASGDLGSLNAAQLEILAQNIADEIDGDPNADGIHLDIEPYDDKLLELVDNINSKTSKPVTVAVNISNPSDKLFTSCEFVILMNYDLDTNWIVYGNKSKKRANDFLNAATNAGGYGMIGVPAIATHHEYEYRINKTSGTNESSGYLMIDYLIPSVRAAENAVQNVSDEYYVGMSIWAFLNEPVGLYDKDNLSTPEIEGQWKYYPYNISTEEWKFLEGADAEITSWNVTSGAFYPGEQVEANITVKNTGSVGYTFYVGYSVKDPSGNYSDANYTRVYLDSGSSSTVQLYWTVPEDAVNGSYGAIVAVWMKECKYLNDTLHGRLDYEEDSDMFKVLSPASLRIGYQPSTHHLAHITAMEKGWWEEDLKMFGVENVTDREFPSGPPEMQAMMNGEIDIAYVGVTPFIAAIGNGLDAKIVAGVQINGSHLVLRPEINYSSPEDLIGLRIATFPLCSVMDIIFKKWLMNNGLDPDNDLEIIPMGPEEAIEAIENGSVEGVFLPHPLPAMIELNGSGRMVIASSEMWPNHACCCLVVSGKLIREHPEMVTQIIKTHIKSTEYVIDHQDEAAEIYVNKTGVNISAVNYSLNTWDGAWISNPRIELNSTLEYTKIMYNLSCVNRSLTKDDLFNFSFYDTALLIMRTW